MNLLYFNNFLSGKEIIKNKLNSSPFGLHYYLSGFQERQNRSLLLAKSRNSQLLLDRDYFCIPDVSKSYLDIQRELLQPCRQNSNNSLPQKQRGASNPF